MNKTKKMMYYRWVVWGNLCVIFLIVIFHRLALGVMREELAYQFGMTATVFASLSSMYFYVYMFMQIPTGILTDTLGVRKTVTAGTLLAGAGSVLFGFAPNIYILFVGRFFVGIGVSVVFISILKIISEWFYEKEFATVSSLISVIGNIGGILTQMPLVYLVALVTWRYTFVMVGGLGILLAFSCYFIVRDRPSEIGLPDINIPRETNEVKVSKGVFKVLLEVIKNRYTWPPFLMIMGFQGGYLSLVGTWGQAYFTDVYGLDMVTSSKYVSFGIIGMTIGSFFFGKISDILIKRKLPMMVLGTIYLVTWGVLVFYKGGKPPLELLQVLMITMGISYATVTLTWVCAKEVNDPEYAGISTSFVNIGGFLGAAIVPVVFGLILDKYRDVLNAQQLYNKGFMFCFVSVVAGYAALVALKETNCKNIYRSKSECSHAVSSNKIKLT